MRHLNGSSKLSNSEGRTLRGFLLLLLSLVWSDFNAQTGVRMDEYSGADSVVNSFLKRWNIKGGAVAITQQGSLVYNRGFGYTDNEGVKIAKPHDLFRIASVSKPITSIAIMKLVEQGKLKLSDSVFGKTNILSDPYYLEVISDERIKTITVQHLLEHSAGWDRRSSYLNYQGCDPPFMPLLVTELEAAPNPVGDSTLIRFSLQKGLDHQPGTAYAYSNIGYLILGKVIEKASGLKYEKYIEEQIFKPLNISDLHLGKNLLEARQERETEYISDSSVLSCYGTGKQVPSQYGGFNVEAMNAHGGWIASVSELSKLILAVDGFSSSPDILSAQTISLMSQPSAINRSYAKGWMVNKYNNWWHSGSLEGTSSFVCRTQNGYTFAFLFNSRSDNSTEFWHELDQLPWEMLDATEKFPRINLFPPAKNVSNIQAEVLSAGTVSVSWSKGSGDGRLVVVSEEPVMDDFPEDGLSYLGESEFGKGSKLDDHTYVVYNSYGRSTLITGLDPNKAYYISAFEYYMNRNTGFYEVYKLGAREKILVVPGAGGRASL